VQLNFLACSFSFKTKNASKNEEKNRKEKKRVKINRLRSEVIKNKKGVKINWLRKERFLC